MSLMINKYLKFDNIEFDGQLVKNVTTLNMLPDVPDKYFEDSYILNIKLEDDRLLEAISFELYENTDYWDVLLVLNGMTCMGQLPVNFDIVMERANKRLLGWRIKGKLMDSFIDQEELSAKYDEILKEEIEKNEKHRLLKYISKSNLSELDADLDSVEGFVKIDPRLITNS